MKRRIPLVLALAVVLAGPGCRVAPSGDGPVADRGVEASEGRRWLERGVAQFEQGRFADAIRTLQESPEIAADGPQVRAQALKYVAFAQCVSDRRAACRRTFEALLALDPSFTLAPAESGHPMWEPELARARGAVAGHGAGAAPRARR
jgi:hypothetical protein